MDTFNVGDTVKRGGAWGVVRSLDTNGMPRDVEWFAGTEFASLRSDFSFDLVLSDETAMQILKRTQKKRQQYLLKAKRRYVPVAER